MQAHEQRLSNLNVSKLKYDVYAHELKSALVQLSDILEAFDAKYNHNHGPDGRFSDAAHGVTPGAGRRFARRNSQQKKRLGKINTPKSTLVTLHRSQIYADMNKSMISGNPARETAFFGAASQVTGLFGLGGSELNEMLPSGLIMRPSSNSTMHLTILGTQLYEQVNRPAYEGLFDGTPVKDLENNLHGKMLDYAMVRKEQSFVQNYLNAMHPFLRNIFIKDLTEALNTYGTPDQQRVIKQISKKEKFNFGIQAHREALGYDAVDRARSRNIRSRK